jgi:hypothetical protein
MITSLYAKLIGAGLLLAALAGLYAYGHHQGAASVQAKWNAALATQAVVDAKASEAARATEHAQANDFADISADYLKESTHAYPSLADGLPAAVDAGAVQLRDACPAPVARGGVPDATAASRAADAAATQALADRVAHSIAAVRAGDDADARERQLGAQVIALQAALAAERKPAPPR